MEQVAEIAVLALIGIGCGIAASLLDYVWRHYIRPRFRWH